MLFADISLLAQSPLSPAVGGMAWSTSLFSILAIPSDATSYRKIQRFIGLATAVERPLGLRWKQAPAHTAIRYTLQVKPAAAEVAFRAHAAVLAGDRATV